MGAALINNVTTTHKAVAITFDDGPDPLYTPQVLEVFENVSGKATFFMIGEQMQKYPDVVKTVAEYGHEVANHTYSHARLTVLNSDECLKEIQRTEKIIEEMTGKRPVSLRPPFLDFNDEVGSLTKSKGYSVIGALNTEAKDWAMPGVEHILNETRNSIKNGSILIFHDGLGDRSQTVEAVRTLVEELNAEGYQLVTVSELLELSSY